MRLPVPGPRDVLSALERGGDQVEALIGAVPRALALLDRAETLLDGASAAVGRVREVTEAANVVVVRAGAVIDEAEVAVARVTTLTDSLEPSRTRLQPTLETLADTTHPDEVAALVRLVDTLPELTERVETDVLPVLATLGSVAPDVHDLLTVARELNDMLAKIPGMGRLKRRIDEEEGEDETDAPVR
jgi:ABC-type transporter Mla subunit MlaD